MSGRTETGGRRVYMCGGYNTCGSAACHYNAVEADPLADAILSKLAVTWGEGTNIDAIMAEIDRQDAAEAGEGGRKVETLKRRLRQLDADLAEGIARLRSIDRSLLEDYQQGVKALRAERDKVDAELRRAGSEPTRAADQRQQVEGAVDVLRRLDVASAADEPDLLRDVLAEAVTKIEVWFCHEPRGKQIRCKFARALVWVREDVALLYSIVPNSWEL